MDNEEGQVHHGSGFLIGLLVGGLLGAAAAYFAAADKEDKEGLVAKGRELWGNIKDFREGVGEKGEGVAEEVKEKEEDFPDVAQDAVESVQVAAKEAIAKITQVAEKTENKARYPTRKFFLSKGRPLAKK